MQPIIDLREIVKAYRRGLFQRSVPALRGLTLRVQPGEVYALIGPNGAGKTTSFRVLLGLVRPDSGTGSILGLPLGDPEARRRLGFLPETPCIYPYLTVAEFLLLAGRLSGVAEPRRAASRAIERFELESLRDRPLRKLSKGQLQRVGIAQAALHDPPLLILDEPMSGLDPLGRAQIQDWIRSLRREGRTVLFASHVLADVEALADRVGILRRGTMALEGPAEELLRGTDSETEVEFALPEPQETLIEGLPARLERRPGVLAARVASGEETEVSRLLSMILARGGTIRSVSRRRRSLESLYVESMSDPPPQATAREKAA